jgi:hypothetical protein
VWDKASPPRFKFFIENIILRGFVKFETFEKVFFGHPELVSGSQNMLVLLDAETTLKQVQHKVRYDMTQYFMTFAKVSVRVRRQTIKEKTPSDFSERGFCFL